MTSVISIGPAFTTVINVIYALPARTVRMRAQPVTGVVISNDGVTFSGPTFDATGQADVSGGFLKDTTGGSIIKLSAY